MSAFSTNVSSTLNARARARTSELESNRWGDKIHGTFLHNSQFLQSISHIIDGTLWYNCLQPNSHGLPPNRNGLQPKSDDLQPNRIATNLIGIASNLRTAASNPRKKHPN